MRFAFLASFHPDVFILVPTIVITSVYCDDPKCGALHGTQVTLDWLLWSADFTAVNR